MTVNICFHGIGQCTSEREPGEARYWMPEGVFLRVLDAFVGVPGVALSFDDGNRSDVEIALPALLERGLHGTFFALAGRLDDAASLSGSDLRELRRAGMAIGNHGWAHAPWRGLNDVDAEREIGYARLVLAEASAGDITEAALPLGRYDRETLQRLRRARYQAVYSSDRFHSTEHTWLRARYSVTCTDDENSVSRIARGRTGVREARNRAVSFLKGLR